MPLDLSDEETDALATLLRRAIDDDRYPFSPRISDLKDDPRQDPGGADARAPTATEGLRAAPSDNSQKAALNQTGHSREESMPELAKVFEDRLTPGDWRVEWEDEDGGVEVTIFSGPDARERALQYAGWRYREFAELPQRHG